MSRKLTATQRLSRREAFRLAGAAGAMALVGRNIAGQPAIAQATSVLACVLTPALTEGPYFVDEKLNRSDIRTDPSDNSVTPGVPLILNMTVQRVENGAIARSESGATVFGIAAPIHPRMPDEEMTKCSTNTVRGKCERNSIREWSSISCAHGSMLERPTTDGLKGPRYPPGVPVGEGSLTPERRPSPVRQWAGRRGGV